MLEVDSLWQDGYCSPEAFLPLQLACLSAGWLLLVDCFAAAAAVGLLLAYQHLLELCPPPVAASAAVLPVLPCCRALAWN